MCGSRNCYSGILLPFVVAAWEPALVPAQSMAEALSLPADYSIPAAFLFGRFIFAKCFIIFYEFRSTEIQGICLVCFLLKQTKECRPISDLLPPVTSMEFQEATTGAETPPGTGLTFASWSPAGSCPPQPQPRLISKGLTLQAH